MPSLLLGCSRGNIAFCDNSSRLYSPSSSCQQQVANCCGGCGNVGRGPRETIARNEQFACFQTYSRIISTRNRFGDYGSNRRPVGLAMVPHHVVTGCSADICFVSYVTAPNDTLAGRLVTPGVQRCVQAAVQPLSGSVTGCKAVSPQQLLHPTSYSLDSRRCV